MYCEKSPAPSGVRTAETVFQPSFSVANARFSLRGPDDTWSVDLWARNVFDKDYYRRVIPATFQTGSYSAFLGDPRTYGITLRRTF